MSRLMTTGDIVERPRRSRLPGSIRASEAGRVPVLVSWPMKRFQIWSDRFREVASHGHLAPRLYVLYDGRSVILTSDTHGTRALLLTAASNLRTCSGKGRSSAKPRIGTREQQARRYRYRNHTHNTLPLTLSVPDLGQGSADYARKLTFSIAKRSSDPSRRTWGRSPGSRRLSFL